jgi:hypothetical protein
MEGAMAKLYYVDANVLDDLARDHAKALGELHDLLRMSQSGMYGAPQRGWDHGAWWDVRTTLNGELTLLDQDRSALASRAARVRVVSVEAALRQWIESWLRPVYLYTGRVFMSSLDSIDKLSDKTRAAVIGVLFGFLRHGVPGLAMLGLKVYMSGGKVIVAGSPLLRFLSGVGAATRMNPSTFAGKVLGGARGLAIQLPFDAVVYGVQNWVLYGKEGMGKVVTATAADVVFKTALTVTIVAGATALGVSASPVLVAAGAGIAAGLIVDFVRKTDGYKAFIADPVKFAKDTGGAILDVGRETVNEAVDTATTAISTAGKAIDDALDSTIKRVTKPLDTVASWFG